MNWVSMGSFLRGTLIRGPAISRTFGVTLG